MEELGIIELASGQIEELCSVAEEAARKYVLSKVPLKKVETLNISSDAEGSKPVALAVEVDVVLASSMRNFDVQGLVDGAVKEAFISARKYLRGLSCHSKK